MSMSANDVFVDAAELEPDLALLESLRWARKEFLDRICEASVSRGADVLATLRLEVMYQVAEFLLRARGVETEEQIRMLAELHNEYIVELTKDPTKAARLSRDRLLYGRQLPAGADHRAERPGTLDQSNLALIPRRADVGTRRPAARRSLRAARWRSRPQRQGCRSARSERWSVCSHRACGICAAHREGELRNAQSLSDDLVGRAGDGRNGPGRRAGGAALYARRRGRHCAQRRAERAPQDRIRAAFARSSTAMAAANRSRRLRGSGSATWASGATALLR